MTHIRQSLSFALALAVSTISIVAHADLYCPDSRLGYTPDEMTSTASQALAETARDQVCNTYCAPFCKVSDGEGGDACYWNAPDGFAAIIGDPDVAADAAASCESCMDLRCSTAVDACMADGSTP